MSNQPGSDMPTQSPGVRGGGAGAFRVCTADDFGHRQRQGVLRRQSGHTTTACRMCRLRKVKCVESWSASGQGRPRPGCHPCQQAELECQWDTVDGRKRRRLARDRLSSPNQEGEPPEAPDGTAALSQKGVDTACERELDACNSGAPNLNQAAATSAAPLLVTATPISTPFPPGFDAPFDFGDAQSPTQFSAEIRPDEIGQSPRIWTDIQDFVLGLDFAEGADGFGTYPDLALSPAGPQGLDVAQAAKPRTVRLRYYRCFGPTAAVPGLRRLVLVVDPDEEHHLSPAADKADADATALTPQAQSSPASSTASHDSKLFDMSTREPLPEIVHKVLDIFFQHFGDHFPFLHPQILGGHVRSREASSFLLNAMAGLTVRFCSTDGALAVLQEKYDMPWRRGAPFLIKAKEQLVPLLSIPAPEVVAGLIVLAWAEFGDNNEAGLWMYAGMAIRMAQDLGFHRISEAGSDPDINFHDHARPSPDGTYILTDEQSTIHQQKARLVMFWSVFILDVCVSLVTGRPPTIRRDEIEIPVPSFNDMKLAQLDSDKEVSARNMLFPATVEFMLHFSEALELLNQTPSRQKNAEASSTAAPALDRHARLAQTRQALVQRYSMLHPDLALNIENFKASSATGQSRIFLMLHLFFYTFITLVSNTHPRDVWQGLHTQTYRPFGGDICQDALPHGTNSGSAGEQQPNNTAMIACQKVLHILSVAGLVDKKSFLASPFTHHCLFVAASTVLGDPGRSEMNPQHCGSLFALTGSADYDQLYRTLQDQATYFGGIKPVVALLEQKHRARTRDDENGGNQTDENDEQEEGMQRVAALDDLGIVNRYSIPGRAITETHRCIN